LELPKTVKRALEIDAETNKTFWRDVLHREMSGIEPVIEILPEGSQPPVGYQNITGHLIFDIKMDITRKL
jgi:hypothetical protein